jgi:hypothetical protein
VPEAEIKELILSVCLWPFSDPYVLNLSVRLLDIISMLVRVDYTVPSVNFGWSSSKFSQLAFDPTCA